MVINTRGFSSVEHLFKVAAGLDSQIIGDYEILSQLKHAAKQAKENNCINSFMERVINYALQASKEIKTTTKLSSGTVSVSYAAIEIIKERITELNNKKILLVGQENLEIILVKILKIIYQLHLFFLQTEQIKKHLNWQMNAMENLFLIKI